MEEQTHVSIEQQLEHLQETQAKPDVIVGDKKYYYPVVPDRFEEDLTDVPAEEIMFYKSYNSVIYYGQKFLPQDFKRTRSPWFHYVIDDIMHKDNNNSVCLTLPRESAKTTYFKALITRDFCFGKEFLEYLADISTSRLKEYWEQAAKERVPHFYIWISKSQEDSISNVAYVAENLDKNEKIIYYFGRGRSLKGSMWNKEEIVTRYVDKLLSSSNVKNARGKTFSTVNFGVIRPDKIIADDFENEENTKTHKSRKGIKRTLLAGVLASIDKNRKNSFLITVGTPVHGDSFIQNQIDLYERAYKSGNVDKLSWNIVVLRSTQKDMKGGVLWHEHRPRETLDRLKLEYIETKSIDLYYQEYELKVSSEEGKRWNARDITEYKGSVVSKGGETYIIISGRTILVNVYIGVDSNTETESRDKDEAVVMVIGVDCEGNRYSLHYINERFLPYKGRRREDGSLDVGERLGIVDFAFEFYEKYNAKRMNVEHTTQSDGLKRMFIEEGRRRNKMSGYVYSYAWVKVPKTMDKVERIHLNLDMYFKSGMIYMMETHHELIDQAMNLSANMPLDDIIDAFDIAMHRVILPKDGHGSYNEPAYVHDDIDGAVKLAGFKGVLVDDRGYVVGTDKKVRSERRGRRKTRVSVMNMLHRN